MKRFSLLLTMLCVLAVSGFAQQKAPRPAGVKFGKEFFGQAPVSEPLKSSFTMKNVVNNRDGGSSTWAHAMYIPPFGQNNGVYYTIEKNGDSFSTVPVKGYPGYYFGAAENVVDRDGESKVYAYASNLTKGYGNIDKDNGMFTKIEAVSMNMNDMTYDYVHDKMFGLKDGNIYLLEYNDKGQLTFEEPVFNYEEEWAGYPIMAIAADLEGHLYGVDGTHGFNDSYLLRWDIDETGHLGSFYYFGSNGHYCKYTQTMAFNHETNELFWWQCGEDSNDKNIIKITINGDNFTCENVAPNIGTQMGGLFFEFDYREYDLTYNDVEEAVEFSDDNPAKAFPGETVTVVPEVADCYTLGPNTMYYTVEGDDARHYIGMVDGDYSFIMPVGNVSVYAEPIVNRYTVAFKDMNQEETIFDTIVDCGADIESKIPEVPEEVGFTAIGWFDTETNDNPEGLDHIDRDRTLYAVYDTTFITLTVNYKYENGDTAVDPTIIESLMIGDEYSVESPAISCYTPDLLVVDGEVSATDIEAGEVVKTVTYTQDTYIVSVEDGEGITLNIVETEYGCGDSIHVKYTVTEGYALRELLVKATGDDAAVPFVIVKNDSIVKFLLDKDVTVSVASSSAILVGDIDNVCDGDNITVPAVSGFIASNYKFQVKYSNATWGEEYLTTEQLADSVFAGGTYDYRAVETNNNYGTFYTETKLFEVFGGNSMEFPEGEQQNQVCVGTDIIIIAKDFDDEGGLYSWTKGHPDNPSFVFEETGNQLTIPNAQTNDAGYYYVTYTSSHGCTTEPKYIPVSVMLLPQVPEIITENGDRESTDLCNINSGVTLMYDNGTFDPEDYMYQWYKVVAVTESGEFTLDLISGATSHYYETGELSDTTAYLLEIWYYNDYEGCKVMSEPFTVNVKPGYDFEIQSNVYQNQTCVSYLPYGGKLSVENPGARGEGGTGFTPNFDSYQWYLGKEEEGVYVYDQIDGATESELHLDNESYSYFYAEPGVLNFVVVATDDNGCEYPSDTLHFIVNDTPEYLLLNDYSTDTVRPGDINKIIHAGTGKTVTLKVKSDEIGLTYTWYKGDVRQEIIEGAVFSTLEVMEEGVYTVNVQNSETTYCEIPATVTVLFEDYWTSLPEYRDENWYNNCLTFGNFEINNEKQLAAFLWIVNDSDGGYERLLNNPDAVVFINNNIYMREHLWPMFDPQGRFTGTINGVGHAISNIRMNESNTYPTVGVNNAHVRNLGFKDVKVENGDIVVENNSVIQNGYITRDLADNYDVLEHLTLAQTAPGAKVENFYANNTYDATASFFELVEEPVVRTIGDENSEQGNMALPFNLASTESFPSQQIYTKEQLGRRGIINKMTFYYTGEGSFSGDATIYLAHTDENYFESATDEYEYKDSDDSWVEVYNGLVSVNGTESIITFDSPFEYDGNSNLVLSIVSSFEEGSDAAAGFKVYKHNDYITSLYGLNLDSNAEGVSANNNVITLHQTSYSFKLNTEVTYGEEILDVLNGWVENQTSSNYHTWIEDDGSNYGWPIMEDLYLAKHNVYARRYLEPILSEYYQDQLDCGDKGVGENAGGVIFAGQSQRQQRAMPAFDTIQLNEEPLNYGDVYNYGDDVLGAKLDTIGFTRDVSSIVGVMGDEDVYEPVFFTRNIHTLNAYCKDEQGNILMEGHVCRQYGFTQIIDVPEITGYDVVVDENWEMDEHGKYYFEVTMLDEDMTVNIYYTAHVHTLTINYLDVSDPYSWEESLVVAAQLNKELKYNASYSYPSPVLLGYETPYPSVVSGTMEDENVEVNVIYEPKWYNLTINYVYENGDPAAGTHNDVIPFKRAYDVISPVIDRYAPDYSIVSGVMPAQDTTWTVTYKFDENWYWTDPEIRDITWYNEENDAFILTTGNELGGLSALVNGMIDGVAPVSFEGKTINVENAIDLSAYWWTPIGGIYDIDDQFKGTFTANNYPITGMRVQTDETNYSCRGFFGVVGANGKVDGLNISGEVEGYYYAAGIAGKNFGTIVNSTSAVNVTSVWEAGGIVAHNSRGRVENCYNTGTLECTSAGEAPTRAAYYYVGGIVAENQNGTIVNCHNVGEFVRGNGENVAYYGGIVGSTTGNVINSYWMDNIEVGAGLGTLNPTCRQFTLDEAEGIQGELQSYVTATPGLYSWTMEDSQWPVFDKNREIMDVTEEGMEIALYPNPTRNVINVVANGIKRVTVYSAYGQMIIDQEFEGDKYSIDMSQFATGSYMVRVYTEDGVASRGFIKTR